MVYVNIVFVVWYYLPSDEEKNWLIDAELWFDIYTWSMQALCY